MLKNDLLTFNFYLFITTFFINFFYFYFIKNNNNNNNKKVSFIINIKFASFLFANSLIGMKRS